MAGLIQQALKHRRAVIVILLMRWQCMSLLLALAAFEAQLGEPPTRLRYSFSPVPTITEVCKEAILGGALPDACHGNLSQTLLRRYGLTAESTPARRRTGRTPSVSVLRVPCDCLCTGTTGSTSSSPP